MFPEGGSDYGLLLLGIPRGAFGSDATYDAALAEFGAVVRASPEVPGERVRLPGALRYANARRARSTT